MKSEFDSYLVDKYPKIFINRYSSIKHSAMGFGFDIGDGWFWLLDQLCYTIQSYIDNNNKFRDDDKKIHQVVARQIKEKYGTLDFYYDGGDDNIDGMVRFAENMSASICERCGSTENVGATSGWIYIICKKCYDKSTSETKNLTWTPNKLSVLDDKIKETRKIKIDKLNQ